jgi:hypothetical protein
MSDKPTITYNDEDIRTIAESIRTLIGKPLELPKPKPKPKAA